MIHQAKWVDAQAMAKQHPDTFYCPSTRELKALKVGWAVKICDNKERFWVQVKSIQGKVCTGLVDNVLQSGQPYAQPESVIQFELRHIYQVQTPEDKAAKIAMIDLLMASGLSLEQAIQRLA